MAARASKEDPDKINDWEKRFIEAYFEFNFNGRLAYLHLKPDVTDKSADVLAHKLLALPRVKNYIENKQAHIAIQEDIKLSWVVKELKSIVEEVKLEITERDPATGRVISRPDRQSSLKALAQLSKIAGFETRKMDITTNGESINKITWNETKSYTPDKKDLGNEDINIYDINT